MCEETHTVEAMCPKCHGTGVTQDGSEFPDHFGFPCGYCNKSGCVVIEFVPFDVLKPIPDRITRIHEDSRIFGNGKSREEYQKERDADNSKQPGRIKLIFPQSYAD